MKSVTPEDDFILSVLFTDGVRKEYDIKPLFDKWPAFRSLKEIPGLYKQVCVDVGGYGISWNDEIDLEGNEIRENGKDIWDSDFTKVTPAEKKELRQKK